MAEMHPIKIRRTHKFLNLEQLAEMTGFSANLISFIERGNRRVTEKTMPDLASALEISIKVLGKEIRDWEGRNMGVLAPK